MEEDEYRTAYNEITRIPCAFEKALTNNACRCSCARHFWLADREGYACRFTEASTTCAALLERLRENSRFSLKLPALGSRLPHNMEIRVQVGGLNGLQRQSAGSGDKPVDDVRNLVETALAEAGGMDRLPWNEIVKSVAAYNVRSRRKKERND